jgi:hypothetical protein
MPSPQVAGLNIVWIGSSSSEHDKYTRLFFSLQLLETVVFVYQPQYLVKYGNSLNIIEHLFCIIEQTSTIIATWNKQEIKLFLELSSLYRFSCF